MIKCHILRVVLTSYMVKLCNIGITVFEIGITQLVGFVLACPPTQQMFFNVIIVE